MEVIADMAQIIGEVKERNKFYKALTVIRKIAETSCTTNKKLPSEAKKQFKEIISICDEAFKDVI
jgi:hypothetical protein